MVKRGVVRKVEEEATWPSHWDGGKESPPVQPSRIESSVAVTMPAEAPAALVLGSVAVIIAIILGAMSLLPTRVAYGDAPAARAQHQIMSTGPDGVAVTR
jgi:hypothetical protein